MRTFVQELEPRTLFAATSMVGLTLVEDLLGIISDTKSVKATLLTSGAAYKADTQKLAADLKKAGGTTNAALLKKLKSDEAGTFAKLRADTGKLIGPVIATSEKSTVHGLALARKSSAAGVAKVQADIAALNGVTTAPLATLHGDLAASAVAADITAAGTANPSNAAVTADVGKLTADQATFTAYLAATQKLATDVSKLSTDLGTLIV